MSEHDPHGEAIAATLDRMEQMTDGELQDLTSSDTLGMVAMCMLVERENNRRAIERAMREHREAN